MSLTHLNWFNSFYRIVIQGYAKSPESREKLSNLSGSEFQQFYEDVYPVGVDLGLLDPHVKTAGRRTLKEANFFTVSGNGDLWMSMNEGAEEIGLLMSGGSTAKSILEDMQLLCRSCAQSQIDSFGNMKVDKRYLFKTFDKNYEKYFRGLPDMSAYYSGLSLDKRNEFLIQYLEASLDSINQIDMGLPELRVFSVLFYFTESLMLKFDRDRSGYLDLLEVEAAFPTFEMLFAEVWQKQTGSVGSYEDLMAVFVYLLHNGEVLQAGDGWISKFRAWKTLRKYKNDRHELGVHVSRMGLSKVFSVMRKHLSR